MSYEVQITIDCADPGRLARFWAEALGYTVEPPPAGFTTWEECLTTWGVPKELWNSRSAVVDPERKGPRLFFQQVPEAKSVKNRVHLDVRAAPSVDGGPRPTGADRMRILRERADALVGIGAEIDRVVEGDQTNGGAGWIVMRDPEGNEFCLD